MYLSFALMDFWPLVQCVACLVIVLRLITFRRGASRHRHGMAWLAWAYIVICTAIAVKLVCGVRPPPGPIEAMFTVALAVLVLVHRGNLAHVLRAPQSLLAWIVRRDTW